MSHHVQVGSHRAELSSPPYWADATLMPSHDREQATVAIRVIATLDYCSGICEALKQLVKHASASTRVVAAPGKCARTLDTLTPATYPTSSVPKRDTHHYTTCSVLVTGRVPHSRPYIPSHPTCFVPILCSGMFRMDYGRRTVSYGSFMGSRFVPASSAYPVGSVRKPGWS